MIEFRANKPTIQEYRNLYESTGWVSVKSISDVMLQKAIENSWFCVSVYDDETIIGIGRLISDGALYAFVCDMIVLPLYQRKGIGSTILRMLKEKCNETGFQRVWLFSAPERIEFYVKNGFEKRPENAPGMQMIRIGQ
ncbi:MAG TPA: GNAT family N-acetyltransferase [Spirochaetota bacterium]|nr:GNAT family N-acetyltransferase [Spirochaetota bacterium]HQP48384.1 GNAT family N-acetyltransferase [Spirochaetota bacterium]